MAKVTTREYADLGEKLKELRDLRRMTQEELAAALSLHVNSIASFERGSHRPLFETLINFSTVLGLDEYEWNELRDIYEIVIRRVVDPHSITPVRHSSVVIDEETDRVGRLNCLKSFYENQRDYHSSDHMNNRLLSRIFAFTPLPPVPIISGIHGVQSSGPAVLSATDQRGALLLADIVDSLNIRRKFLNDSEDRVPQISTSSLIIAGGPGSCKTSVEVNQLFSTEQWFNGFWFHTDDLNNEWGWVVRHRALEEVSITMADISDINKRRADGRPPYRKLQRERTVDDRPPYQKLQDNENQDYGLIFVGPNPANTKHRLVLIAGLRGMGTFAAARALNEPPIVEIIARELLLRRRYVSALVRYRFLDQEGKRFLGHISSICLTTGMVPES